MEQQGPPPFPAEWLDTVFLVPRPPAGWPEAFAIVTAHNPGSTAADADANLRAERALRDWATGRGLACFDVTGASPDLRHREHGLGIAGLALGEVAALARDLGQDGFFVVCGDQVLACVDASGRAWRIGSWSERLQRGGSSTKALATEAERA